MSKNGGSPVRSHPPRLELRHGDGYPLLFLIGQPPVAQMPVAQIPWAHNGLLLQKVKDEGQRRWYASQTLVQGWSHETLAARLRSEAHLRQDGAVTDFARSLPAAQSALAQERLRDPYIFDFLTLTEPFQVRELETGLVQHIEKFLLELGRGFAFLGRQYRLDVNDREFYLDLLFYHLALRCFVNHHIFHEPRQDSKMPSGLPVPFPLLDKGDDPARRLQGT